MREIKFRAYSEQDAIMYRPLSLRVIAQLGHDFSDNIKLMQYTGLKDKNGKAIYEGDIVDYDGEIAKVTYENTMASFCVGGNNFDSSEAKYMKIIGNFYENPELLEEKE